MAAIHDQPSVGGLLSAPASVVSCSQCFKEPAPGHPLRFCGRCKNAQYCDVNCQRADWARHKQTCMLERDMRRITPVAERNLGSVLPLHEWYQTNSALANCVMCLAWRHRGESPLILVQTSAVIGKWRVSIRPRSEWEADREAEQMVHAAASAVGWGGRGLHSFPFQLNLSSLVHYTTKLDYEHVLELLKLSSKVNDCKPLVGGEASPDTAQQQAAADFATSTLQQTPRPDSEILALAASMGRISTSSTDEFGHLIIPYHAFESFYACEDFNPDKIVLVLFDVRHLRTEFLTACGQTFSDEMADVARDATGERELRAKAGGVLTSTSTRPTLKRDLLLLVLCTVYAACQYEF
jgi:hypothetical protein